MTISVGDRLPNTKFVKATADGPDQIESESFFAGRKVALFAVPGAFTPTCSAKHLPGYVEKMEAFKDKGIDVACLSVNDAFVMGAWARDQSVPEGLRMLADGNGVFTKALGLELDATPFGPGVAPHLTPFMEGRGRPGRSGPLDGDGRRSLYLNVRRNFLTPMLLAFDYPSPATTMGRRNVSNVPAQSLTMLNDPFVLDQARRWADRVLAEGDQAPEARVSSLFQTAFGRPPTDRERSAALAFLDGQAATYGMPGDARAWADLCHVLFNIKEFIYVN